MDCKEFRQILDLFVDNELSAEAMTSAQTHLSECGACRGVAEGMRNLRRAVKEAVGRGEAARDLMERVRRATCAPRRRAPVLAGIAAALILVSLVTFAPGSGFRLFLASGMERIAFHMDRPQTLALEGELVCRGCELHALYGSPERPDAKGHHGALKTADGKIWNFIGSEKVDALIHDPSLLGKRVRIRGKLYRRAGCLEVESYEVLETT